LSYRELNKGNTLTLIAHNSFKNYRIAIKKIDFFKLKLFSIQ